MELSEDNITLYLQIGKMLDAICEKYFDEVADGTWQYYSHWEISDDETIHLYYYYYDYNEYLDNEITEVDYIKVKVTDLREFSKTLNK